VEIEAVLDRALEHARLLAQLDAYRKDLEERVLSRVKTQKAFHEEVLALHAVLMEAQCEREEAGLVAPFLRHLEHRFSPDGCAVLLPRAERWSLLLQRGNRVWPALGSLPEPGALVDTLEWGWEGGYPDGYLVPLRRNELVLGALFLGFEKRSSFDPEDPCFLLLKTQMQAAFHGLRCARAFAEAEARKLGQS
jgi:hypothetical protein